MLFRKKSAINTTITSQIRISRCSSCGAILQNEDKNEVGYISENRIAKHIEEGTCDRCYNLRHFNTPENEFNADYKKILTKATSTNSLIVYVIDLFAFESSLIPNISSFLGDNLLVILNKRDILPSSLSDEDIISNAQKRLALDKIFPKKILLFSSYSKLNISELFTSMNELRKGKDVYFIGGFLVGKSSIVTEMLRQYKNVTDRMISTIKVENTVLDIMEIPLDENSSMYDTPGIFNPSSMINQLERDTYKYIVPREEIKVQTITLDYNQGVLFGLVAILFVESKTKTTFEISISNEVSLTKIRKDKLERSFNDLYRQNKVVPISQFITSVDNLVRKEIVCPLEGNLHLYIYGFGNLAFKGNGQKISVYLPKNVEVKLLVD